jgi:hypothetical protein
MDSHHNVVLPVSTPSGTEEAKKNLTTAIVPSAKLAKTLAMNKASDS